MAKGKKETVVLDTTIQDNANSGKADNSNS